MKKVLTLIFALTTFASAVFAQECPPTITIPSSTRMFLVFGPATDMAANDAAAAFLLASGGTITFTNADGTTGGGNLVSSSNASKPRINVTTGTPSDPFSGTISITGLTCGPYVDGALSVPAPVTLTSFTAKKMEKSILLKWETETEINNDGFVIERGHKTADGIEWSQLDFIKGNGTTQLLQAYSFIDQNPGAGINYYRLKQMDYDANYEYSSVVAVEYSDRTGSTPIAIFPNPVKDQLTLINGEGEATIYNVMGQPVKQLTIAANQATTIQLDELITGQYYLQVLQEDGTIVTKQFAKIY